MVGRLRDYRIFVKCISKAWKAVFYIFSIVVSPTNNHAEQSLRHMVIFRKICFGTRSESGLNNHSILPSLVQTAKRQGVHPRQFSQTLFTVDKPTAQAALYNDSS
jgi:hypothetical protein